MWLLWNVAEKENCGNLIATLEDVRFLSRRFQEEEVTGALKRGSCSSFEAGGIGKKRKRTTRRLINSKEGGGGEACFTKNG